MSKKLLYLILSVTLFVSCEEYYKPGLDPGPGFLVVESLVTNDPGQNFVKLSKTRHFYSVVKPEEVIGAGVDLLETGGETFEGIETTPGNFTFPQTPVPGKEYMIRIFHDNNIFESERVVMPPLPEIDTLYTVHQVKKGYKTDAEGVPYVIEVPIREIRIDAPVTPDLKYYRFSWRAILQWMMPMDIYGWNSMYQSGTFNIAGTKEFSVSEKIQEHPFLSLPYQYQYTGIGEGFQQGWIIYVHQYGIQEESADFYTDLNKQILAEGSLFDPILTQVYGNVHCRNNPSKTVLGFFELCSYRHYRFYLRFGPRVDDTIIQRRINRYPDIPDHGVKNDGKLPSFWESYY